MVTPKVTEIHRPLEPVTQDPFIAKPPLAAPLRDAIPARSEAARVQRVNVSRPELAGHRWR